MKLDALVNLLFSSYVFCGTLRGLARVGLYGLS